MASRNPSRIREARARAWDLKQIQELIDVLIEREITEFEMEKGGLRIHIKRGNADAPSLAATNPSMPSARVPAPSDSHPEPPVPIDTPAPLETPEEESTEGVFIIQSPIVGTFYASPSPNAPPFVKVGDVVQTGQVLCIIEAMKLMNEIESEMPGEIVRIYIESGQPVEYGQSLFAIKPSHKK